MLQIAPITGVFEASVERLLHARQTHVRGKKVDQPSRLHGEEVREGVGEDGEHDEPGADPEQHEPAPPFDGGRLRLDPLHGRLLSARDARGGREQEGDDHERRNGEGGHGSGEPSDHERVPGETRQDRTRSAEPGQDVAEAEDREGGHRALAP